MPADRLFHPLETIALPSVWSFDGHAAWPAVVAQTEPWLAAASEAIQTCVPRPPTVRPFVLRPFYRPPGSHRCFYFFPGSGESGLVLPTDRAVIAFKGLEPCAEDFDHLLRDFRRPCYSPHTIAEHLVFEEQKVPGALTLKEALREAGRAARLQQEHMAAFGTLGRLPVPVAVFRHPASVVDRLLHGLRNEVSLAAFDAIEKFASDGLGVYAYYYPTPPVRVRDVDAFLYGLPFRQRMFALLRVCDPQEVVDRWLHLFAKMLWFGMLPGALTSLRTGISCQPQNATIDGGFVDLDSVTPIDEIATDYSVAAALQFCTGALVDCVRTLLTGISDPTRSDNSEGRFDLHHLRSYVLTSVSKALGAVAPPKGQLDPRIRQYYSETTSIDALVEKLGVYHTPMGTGALSDARDFTPFGLDLLKIASRQEHPGPESKASG